MMMVIPGTLTCPGFMNFARPRPTSFGAKTALITSLTRMDHLAQGIVAYLDSRASGPSLVVRMCGTKADVGVPLLQNRNLPVYEDLTEAARIAVEKAGEALHGYTN